MRLSNTWNVTNTDYYRPVYHHTPLYGWMNDANGLTYKDGEYHLYFQYNPYGSKWGNMHWGHSVSRDLVHWQHLDPAIARDTMGHIFSGSTVVDVNNTAGFGKTPSLLTTLLRATTTGRLNVWLIAKTTAARSRNTKATPCCAPSTD